MEKLRDSSDSIYELVSDEDEESEVTFTCPLEAFKVRQVAKQFQFKDLFLVCDHFILESLDYKNAILYLVISE